MILGNKCDMTDRRQVSKDRGEKVSLKLVVTKKQANQANSVEVIAIFSVWHKYKSMFLFHLAGH